MLKFRKLELKDKQLVDRYVSEGATDGSAYSFGNLFAWADSYQMEIAEYENMLLMRGCDYGQPYYVFPSGKGDVKAAVDAAIAENSGSGKVFMLGPLLENNVKTIQELYPDDFDFYFSRDFSEYVYSTENMANLPGKKFHGKKGHINAFFRNHEDIHIDPITKDNIHHCLEIQSRWFAENGENDEELDFENLAIKRAVKNYSELGFIGAILYADGIPVAFTMGEALKNSTFCTHYEKTLPDYRDAFPVINNGFTKLMLQSFKYVNREEDAGAEGLRKAKLSYHPEFLLKMYTALFKNDKERKYYVDNGDFDELLKLWQTVFGDDRETVSFFIENCVSYGDIYASRLDGKIVSAFYLVDGELLLGNTSHKVKYLYAAATLPEYRNRGIMSEMIKYAAEISTMKEYEFIVLCPASQKLFDYYEKLGFRTYFSENIYSLTHSELEKFKGARYFNSSLSYQDMREHIPSRSFMKFSDGYVDFARYLAKNGGFEITAVFDDEDRVFVIGSNENGVVTVDEAISSDGNYTHILNVLADMNADKILLKTPECIILENFSFQRRNSGMLLSLTDEISDDENIYLGQPCI